MHLTEEQYKIQGHREGKQSTFMWLGHGNYRQQASALKPQGPFWWIPTSLSYRGPVATVKGRDGRCWRIIPFQWRHSRKRSEVVGDDEFSTSLSIDL